MKIVKYVMMLLFALSLAVAPAQQATTAKQNHCGKGHHGDNCKGKPWLTSTRPRRIN